MKEKLTTKKILILVFRIVLAIMIIMNLMIIVYENRSGAQFISNVRYSVILVNGRSMEPELKLGDAILVTNEDYRNLSVGDIIVFQRNDELITHKIIEKTGDLLTTQGTANENPDAAVSESEYRAKFVTRIPVLGSVFRIYSNKILFIGWTLFLIVIIFGKQLFGYLYDKIDNKN